MDERVKKAFDYAADLTRQLITLSTVIVAGVIAFFDKAKISDAVYASIRWPLVIYLVSILLGIAALMALTGILSRGGDSPTPYATNVRVCSGLQILTFLAATAWIIIATTSEVGPSSRQWPAWIVPL